jgi:broad specificity phosphatase PhoE
LSLAAINNDIKKISENKITPPRPRYPRPNSILYEEITDKMGKVTLHLVRHAQGFHNLNFANHQLPDPDLTPLGETQCTTLASSFPTFFPTSGTPTITHLVASPLRRTLYTCLLSFPTEVARGLVVTAIPELQETSDLPCDTGSSPQLLAEEFSEKVDLSFLQPGWNSKTGPWSPASSAIEARALTARLYLRSLARSALESGEEDVHIVVVTHGGFLHYFTEDWVGCTAFTGTGWANTECRSYGFEDLEGEGGDASLVETKESRHRRRGSEIPLTRDEQRELRASAEREQVEQGFIQADAKL